LSALLDTSVLVRSLPLGEHELEDTWVVSAVSIGELQAGVLLTAHAAERARRLHRLAAVIAEASILDVDRVVAARYGELRGATGRTPTNDLWIAATALAHDLTLVTGDRRQAALPLVRARLVT
jgi:predicted nucleic acid-binding protein